MCGRRAVGAIRSRGHGCGQETNPDGTSSDKRKPWHSPVPTRPRAPVVGSPVRNTSVRSAKDCMVLIGRVRSGGCGAGNQQGTVRGIRPWSTSVPNSPRSWGLHGLSLSLPTPRLFPRPLPTTRFMHSAIPRALSVGSSPFQLWYSPTSCCPLAPLDPGCLQESLLARHHHSVRLMDFG